MPNYSIEDTIANHIPMVLPANCNRLKVPQFAVNAGMNRRKTAFFRYDSAMTVMVSLDDHDDGAGVWLHVSLSRPNKIPSWQDVKDVKDLFLGDRPAIQLLPPKDNWININDNTLHLFHRLDADTVPQSLWRIR